MPHLNFKIISIVMAVIFIAQILFAFAYYNYPNIDGDAVFFMPTAINFATGNGLIDQISPLATFFNNKFVYYTPLFPIAVSFLLLSPTTYGILRALSLINSLVIILAALLFYRISVISRKEKLDLFATVLIILNLFGLTAVLMHLNGRPEGLAQLILIISLLYGISYYSSKYFFAVVGILLGIMAATHPIGAAISAILFGLACFALFKPENAIYKILGAYLISLVIFLIILYISPYGVHETISGIIKHSHFAFDYSDGANNYFQYLKTRIGYYFWIASAPFFGFLLLLFVGLFLSYFGTIKKPASPKLFFALATLLAGVCILSNKVYYTMLFSPVLMAFVIYYMSNAKRSLIFKFITLAVSALLAIGFLRNVLLFPYFLRYGISLDRARSEFLTMKKDTGSDERILLYSPELWVLSEDYKDLYTPPYHSIIPAGNKIILYKQSSIAPPKIAGCELIKNLFIPESPKINGVRLTSIMPGYAFAAYRCPN